MIQNKLSENGVFALCTGLLGVNNINDFFNVVGRWVPQVCHADYYNLILVNLKAKLYLRHFSPGFPISIFHDYSSEAAKSDLMLQRGFQLEPGQVMHLATLTKEADPPEGWTNLDQNFRAKSGFVDSIAVILYRDLETTWGSGLVLYRSHPNQAFDDADVELVERLGPMLAAGFQNSWNRSFATTSHEALTDIFFNFGNLSLLISRNAAPIYIDGTCEKVLNLIYPDSNAGSLPGELKQTIGELIDLLVANPRMSLVSGEANSPAGPIRIYITPKNELAQKEPAFLAVLMIQPGFSDLEILKEEGFTNRQLETLKLLQRGLNLRDIARQLKLSNNTIKYHIKIIGEKLQASGKQEILSRAIQKTIELAIKKGING